MCGNGAPLQLSTTLPPLPPRPELPDLDLRAADCSLAELAGWVECCAVCGYCNSSIAELHSGTGSTDELTGVLSSAGYRGLLTARQQPELARRFRCMAEQQQHAGADAGLAGLSLLYAAWVCDDYAALDEENVLHPAVAAAQARELRRAAAQALRDCLEAGQVVLDDPALSWLLLADIYRRAEQFPSAHTSTVRGMAVAQEDGLGALLRFEQQAVEAQATEALNMADVFAA